ncbi:hypothetical protein [Oceanobacillus caeni]|uniref:hypothetical protein n=1 Tax=Oceanobacillus caeni TaxID=405946 RepID=UPI0019581D7A
MVLLKDKYYTDSKVQLDLKLNTKRQIEDTLRLDINICFEFGFSKLESTIVWTQEDINILEKQINEISVQSPIGSLATIEPDLNFLYYLLPDQEDDKEPSNKELALYLTLDSGLINNNIGTETGPTIKITTTKKELIKWINDIKDSFL